MKINRRILFFLLNILAFQSYAQSQTHLFHRYSIEDGISQGRITCIIQDYEGFMWFGTNNGLNKFDGHNFTHYQSISNDTTTLLGERILSFFEDSKKRLWVGSGFKGGIHLYNRETDKFIQYLHYSDSEGNFYVANVIIEDDNGYLWIGTTKGLCKFNPDEPKDEIWFKNEENNNKSISDNYITSLCFDNKERLWIGTHKGLNLLDIKTGECVRILNNPNNPRSISDDIILSIYEGSNNKLFIGAQKGLNILTSNSDTEPEFYTFIHLNSDPEDKTSISSDYINMICEDKDNTLWICTNGGLDYIETNSLNFEEQISPAFGHYTYDPQDDESLNYNFIRCAYFDASNVLWVGTNTGLNKSKNYKFICYKQQIAGKGLLSNKVQAIHEDKNGNIWLGTSKGLNFLDRKTNDLTSKRIGVDAIMSISEDRNGDLWFGTWNKGVYKYSVKTKKLTQYNKIEGGEAMVGGIHVNCVFVDSNDNLWISVWSNGLYLLDKITQTLICKNQSPIVKNISAIYEDSKKNLWIGSLGGLSKVVDKEKGSIISHRSNSDYPDSIQGNYIVCIAEDIQKNIWIGTQKGLQIFNQKDNVFTLYNKSDGLPSDKIMAIVPDDKGNLWVSTNNGLSKLSFPLKLSGKEKRTPVIRNYTIDHGLQGREFAERSFFRCKSGDILFGGTNGFNIFNPNNIEDNAVKPNVVITDFLLYNKHVSVGDTINGDIVLTKPVSRTKEIVLSHNNNFFSIQFAALHFVIPDQNKFKYKMEGFDDNWIDIGTERKVSFIGLKPGNYIFRIKASNSDGVWSDSPTSLIIRILPPWWQTVWFRLLVLAFLIFFVYMAIRFRTYTFNQQKQKLEETVELRTTELKEINLILKEKQEKLEQKTSQISEMNNSLQKRNKEIEQMAKQLHEADQTKLRFFANISHEFRTPLALIIGHVEKCLQIDAPADWNDIKKNYIQLIHRNSKRLLRLINQIMDFRKIEQGGKTLALSNNNIVEFVKEVADVFTVMAEGKNIELRMENVKAGASSSPDENYSLFANFWFDPDIMEKILSNLISNAIKYTPEQGTINVELIINNEKLENKNTDSDQFITHNSQFIIKISDTGIGIKPENLDKIFDRFYRSDNADIKEMEGTGIGLAYVKELVKLHHGTITVESEFGKGTTFTVLFPMENDDSGEKVQETTLSTTTKTLNLNYSKSMLEIQDDIEQVMPEITDIDLDYELEKETLNPTLLLIEDNPDMQQFIANELKDTYAIIKANDGAEGLDIAIKEMPDIIISDVMMPRMDGIELSKRLKKHENTSHIPLILLTAKTGESNTIEGLKTGADDYISKPFSTAILKAKIKNLLTTRKLLREKFGLPESIRPEELSTTDIDTKFLKQAFEIVEKNMSDPDFTNDMFIDILGYGRTTTYKKIKMLTNHTITGFIKNIRLKTAAKLLLEEKNNIKEITTLVGFNYRESFYRAFTAMFGKSPTQFVKDSRKNG